jgi:hypothetical protein
MELCPGKKILLAVFSACVVFSVVFASVLTASIIDHDCAGGHCPYCLQIETAKNFAKIVKFAGIGLFLAIRPAFPGRFLKKSAERKDYFLSPVTLKVRFNS